MLFSNRSPAARQSSEQPIKSTVVQSSVSLYLLDASAALWNEINDERPICDNDEDGFQDDACDADTDRLERKYKAVLGAPTAQTVR
jgi:hypothetical protein